MPMKFLVCALFFLVFTLNAWAGTKPSISDFNKDVKIGMLKTEVIAELGSPFTSRRWHGRDRWIYHFYKKDGDIVKKITKELHFENGVVVYKGDPIKPKVSAEEQDEMNLQEVLADQKAWEKRKEDAKKSREEYKKWVEQVHDQDSDSSLTVRQFQPVK